MTELYSKRQDSATQDGYHVFEITFQDFIWSYQNAMLTGDPTVDVITLLKGEVVTGIAVHLKNDWTGSNFVDAKLNITTFDSTYDWQIASLPGISNGVTSGSWFGPCEPVQTSNPAYLTQQSNNYPAIALIVRVALTQFNGDPLTLNAGTITIHLQTMTPPTETIV